MQSNYFGAFFVFLLLGLPMAQLGCAHTGGATAISDVQYPPWVLRGSGVGLGADQNSQAFFGVGQISGMRNVALARSTADNRARAELARALDDFYAQLLSAWAQEQSSSTATLGDSRTGIRGNVEQLAKEQASPEQLIKTLSAAALPSVQIVEHWFHPEDGAVFSLARLELTQMRDNLARSRELTQPLREWLQGHMEAVHQGMLQRGQPQNRADPAPAVTVKENL